MPTVRAVKSLRRQGQGQASVRRAVTRSMAQEKGASPFEYILGGLRNLFSKADDADADFSSRPVGYSASPGRKGETKRAIKKAEKPLPKRR